MAVRLAQSFPDRIANLLLARPATAGGPAVDSRTRIALTNEGASEQTIHATKALSR